MHRFQIFAGILVVTLAAGALYILKGNGAPASADAAIMAGIDTSLPPDKQLQQAYDAKLNNAGYVAYKNGKGGKRYQAFREEAAIKLIRKQIAADLNPTGVAPKRIPLTTHTPTIDGSFANGEWDDALRIDASNDEGESTLFLKATPTHLYLACDATSDTTEDGYDQFRFYYHVDESLLIVNERIHVSKRDGPLGGIRQTRVRWKGAPGKTDAERWKKYPISDWTIYKNARGASTVRGHRRFEAVLELDEAGLPVGKPFPAFAQVESDPIRDENGKFKGRTYIGQVGTQASPVWFVIGD